MEERTINVNGQSTMLFPPDTIKINMVLTNINKEYNEAVVEGNEAFEELRECLKQVGFEKEHIKTTNFQVNTKYENVNLDGGSFKRIFIGYEVMNKIVVEIESNPRYLAKVLNIISTCKAKPEFTITYEIKDKQSLEEKLLEVAIQDAQEKAEIMARTARVKLGKVLKIEGGNVFIGNINNSGLFLKVSEAALDLQPENLQGNANVMVVWRIEG